MAMHTFTYKFLWVKKLNAQVFCLRISYKAAVRVLDLAIISSRLF
jgi:hypothetical protein